MPGGRPRKYGQKLIHKGIQIPEELNLLIESQIEEGNFNNFNEAVIALLTSSDKELAEKFVEKLDSNADILKELAQKNLEFASILERLSKASNPVSIFTEMEKDPIIFEEVEKYKNIHLKRMAYDEENVLPLDERRNISMKYILEKLRFEAAKENKVIKNESMVKKIILGELIRIES